MYENLDDLPEVYRNLHAQLPELVDRKTASFMSGAMVAPGTLANCDSRGEGPAERIRSGRKVAYSRDAFVLWLASRCKFEGQEK